MIAFSPELSREQIEIVRSYVIRRAHESIAEQRQTRR
jgi:hypothetical protein